MHKSNLSYALLFSAWIFVIIGYIVGMKIDPLFFSRFGSIMVLLAVISEYNLSVIEKNNLYNSLAGQGAVECGETGIPYLAPSTKHKIQEYLSHVTVVVGTIIWGFGDLFVI